MSDATLHILRRLQADPRLAYLLGPGSESYDLLTESQAQAEGLEPAEFRRLFKETLQFQVVPPIGTTWSRTDALRLVEQDAELAKLRAELAAQSEALAELRMEVSLQGHFGKTRSQLLAALAGADQIIELATAYIRPQDREALRRELAARGLTDNHLARRMALAAADQPAEVG